MDQTVDISAVIDQSKIGAFQTGIFILCALCLIMDGFDVQALGYLAPAIIKDWSLPPAQMGPVLSAALVGILVGSLLFSMLADRFGRRPVLIVATLFFSLITLWTGLAASISELRLARFIAGVGLGGIMPNAVALVGEYTPRRRRVLMMIVVSNGFNVGAIVAGLVSARMIPVLGWRSVFYFRSRFNFSRSGDRIHRSYGNGWGESIAKPHRLRMQSTLCVKRKPRACL